MPASIEGTEQKWMFNWSPPCGKVFWEVSCMDLESEAHGPNEDLKQNQAPNLNPESLV